jgi:hypothetical protein
VPDLIIPADPEQAIVDALEDVLPVGTGIPEPKPPVFVRVIGVGGTPETIVSDAFTVTIEVYALKESAAAEAAAEVLARLTLASLEGTLGGEVCYRVGVMALPQNYPNPTVPSHARYTMTLVPVLRRRVTHL